ncbi:homoserine dehydrogenase [Dermabacteraceae bacterium P13147]
MTPTLRIAVLGAGTVGAEVIRLLAEQREDLEHRIGAPYRVTGVAVRDLTRERGAHIPRELLTDDAESLVADADIVVEVMGGIEPAGTLLLKAIASGASVVTANKALLAQQGAKLYEAADKNGVDIYYEAAVAGAIPLVRPIRESLAGDSVKRVLGIVNGTTNYILDAMSSTGQSFSQALAKAQELGYAEADPTADVDGLDAAAKAAILGSLAFHTRVSMADVTAEGIREISSADIRAAERMGRVVKLLSIAERLENGVSARVYPVMLRKNHPLASVGGAYNAVFVEAEAAGSLMFYGQGAGGAPTASAVLGDLVTAARNRVVSGHGPRESRYADLAIVPLSELRSRFYVSLQVHDRPGVLAAVASVLSENGISVATVHQEPLPGADGDEYAALEAVTHLASESAMQEALAQLANSESVARVLSVLRVEGE